VVGVRGGRISRTQKKSAQIVWHNITAMGISAVYFDDSGTDHKARIVTAGCCVSNEENWTKFGEKWKSLGAKYGFEHFHMTEFVGCRPNEWCRDCKKRKTTAKDHPWREWSKSKRKNVLTQLTRTIEKYTAWGCGIAVTKKDYEDHVANSPARAVAGEPIGDHHFTYAAQICGGRLSEWRAANNNHDDLKFVFDLCPNAQKDEIESVLFGAATNRFQVENGVEQWFVPLNVSYESRKNVVQLLSADMLAYLSAKIRALELFGRGMTIEAFTAAHIVVGSRGKLNLGYMTRQTLQQWERDVLTGAEREEDTNNETD
jgi:hypothetical protein